MFPTNNSLIPDKANILIISNVQSKNSAIGYIVVWYPNQRIERYLISEHLQIDLELISIGFHFILDNIKANQELKFDYQLFV